MIAYSPETRPRTLLIATVPRTALSAARHATRLDSVSVRPPDSLLPAADVGYSTRLHGCGAAGVEKMQPTIVKVSVARRAKAPAKRARVFWHSTPTTPWCGHCMMLAV